MIREILLTCLNLKYMSVCYYHVTYVFQSESTLYSCLNVKELLEVTETSDIAPVSRKGFLDIQASIDCRFDLKRVRDMIITYSQMHRTDKHPQRSSIILPVWPSG